MPPSAFLPSTPLPVRSRAPSVPVCPRMSVPSSVPVPHRAPTSSQTASLFKRIQTAESYLSPNQHTSLAVQSALPSPTVQSSILRHVFANAHLLDSDLESLQPLLTRYQLTNDARELIRSLAKSHAFTYRFVESCSPWRVAEILYKTLLGRAPASYDEIVKLLAVMQNDGYEAAVDSLVDCAEYTACFGAGLIPRLCVDGSYTTNGGMPAFCAQMRMQLTTRGGNSDVTVRVGQTVGTLGGGSAAGTVEIAAGYEVSVPRYEGQFGWNKLPQSSLSRDWASASLVGSDAVANWSFAGSARKSGSAVGEWKDGWKPEASGEQWKPGWYGSTKSTKQYV